MNKEKDVKIKWVPGGYYNDSMARLWCCVDVSNSHGIYYRCILTREADNSRPDDENPTVERWFRPNGEPSDGKGDHKLVSGPEHPREIASFDFPEKPRPPNAKAVLELPKSFKAKDPVTGTTFLFMESPLDSKMIYSGDAEDRAVYQDGIEKTRALVDYGVGLSALENPANNQSDQCHEDGYKLAEKEAKKVGVCVVCGGPGACCNRCF